MENFWRSLSNLTINVTTPNFGCYSGEFWAVSEAAPMRRVHVNGITTLINNQLARGRNLLLTPGVYNVGTTIKVKRPDAVVLGVGRATITAQHGAVPMTVADVPGVDIAGLIFDAGPVDSPVLLQVGKPHSHKSRSADPTALQDVFFRIGGPYLGKADVSL